jgi:hypothetical protein
MYKSTIVKQADAVVSWPGQQAKIIELGVTSNNLTSTVEHEDGTVTFQRTWPTAEVANAWVAWFLTHPGVTSATVEEIV